MSATIPAAEFLTVVDRFKRAGIPDLEVARGAGLSKNLISRVRNGDVSGVRPQTFEAVLRLVEEVDAGRVELATYGLPHSTISCRCKRAACRNTRRSYRVELAETKARLSGERPRYADGVAARAALAVLIDKGWSRAELIAAGVDARQIERLWSQYPRRVPADVLRRMERLLSVKRSVSPWADRRAS